MKISRGSLMRPGRRLFLAIPVLFAIVACSLMPFASSPAQADVQEDFRIWENVTARGNFGFINPNNPDLKRWRWWGEAQMRYRESGKELDQLLLRPGIGYALTDHSTVFVGYAHVSNPAQSTQAWSRKTESGSNISGQGRRFWAPLPAEHDLKSAGRKTETILECVFVNCSSSTGHFLFIRQQVSCWRTRCSSIWSRRTGDPLHQREDSIKIVVLPGSGIASLQSS